MNFQIDYRSFSGIFAVPSQIRALLPNCSGSALKVLLLILSDPQEPITVARLSALLGFPPADVEEALDYWCQQGILSRKNQFAADSAEQLSFGSVQPKVRRVSQRRNLSMPEVNQLRASDPTVQELIQTAESQLGRLLTSPEQEILCSFYSYDRLSPEYLLLVLMYCVEQGNDSFRYLQKVVNNMLEKNIDSYDKAVRYLEDYTAQRSNENLVRSAFGIHDRQLAQKEKDFIAAWFGELGYDISVVRLAYEECVNAIGKLSFPYINKILLNWHSKGIKTSKEASLETSVQKKSAALHSKNGGMASSFDMEELEQLLNKNSPY